MYTQDKPGTWRRIISHMTILCILAIITRVMMPVRYVLCIKNTKFLSSPVSILDKFHSLVHKCKTSKKLALHKRLCVCGDTVHTTYADSVFVGSLENQHIMLFALDTFVESTCQDVSQAWVPFNEFLNRLLNMSILLTLAGCLTYPPDATQFWW